MRGKINPRASLSPREDWMYKCAGIGAHMPPHTEHTCRAGAIGHVGFFCYFVLFLT